MNEKEIAELRRRFRPEKSCISRIRGCCVNEKKELVSEFDSLLGMLPEAGGGKPARYPEKERSPASAAARSRTSSSRHSRYWTRMSTVC